MAEKDNIQLAEKQIAALNARDLDQYLSRIDDSYVGESETAPGPIRGPEGVRKNLEMFFGAFPDLRLEIEQILASGDHVVVRLGITGIHKGTFAGIAATNKRISFHACSIVELRNGKALRGRIYGDNATLFQQVGCPVAPQGESRWIDQLSDTQKINSREEYVRKVLYWLARSRCTYQSSTSQERTRT